MEPTAIILYQRAALLGLGAFPVVSPSAIPRGATVLQERSLPRAPCEERCRRRRVIGVLPSYESTAIGDSRSSFAARRQDAAGREVLGKCLAVKGAARIPFLFFFFLFFPISCDIPRGPQPSSGILRGMSEVSAIARYDMDTAKGFADKSNNL